MCYCSDTQSHNLSLYALLYAGCKNSSYLAYMITWITRMPM
jgi:hypothetical protein